MQPSSTFAPDGTRLAYDVQGSGPAVILLHGGGMNRESWHQAGYVELLASRFTVVSADLRGHGDSDKPGDPRAYSDGQLCADVIAVADACGLESFAVAGYSYGGGVAGRLATCSARVTRSAMVGAGFGPFLVWDDREQLKALVERRWDIVRGLGAGTVDPASLDEQERKDLRGPWGQRHFVAALQACFDWLPLEPGDLRCPTLVVAGTPGMLANLAQYDAAIRDAQVAVLRVPGGSHMQEFTAVTQVAAGLAEFLS